MPDRRVEEDRQRPEQGDRRDRVGDLAGRAPMTGAVATIAVLPQTADPTAMSTASRSSTRTRRATSRTIANDAAIVTTISPVAGRPIRAISPRLSRAPSRTIPSRRTRCERTRGPASSGLRRGPATAATTIPSRRATVTSATIEGRNTVTRRATTRDGDRRREPGSDRSRAARGSRTRGSGRCEPRREHSAAAPARRSPRRGASSRLEREAAVARAVRTRWNSRV